jgi:hypothetical protein
MNESLGQVYSIGKWIHIFPIWRESPHSLIQRLSQHLMQHPIAAAVARAVTPPADSQEAVLCVRAWEELRRCPWPAQVLAHLTSLLASHAMPHRIASPPHLTPLYNTSPHSCHPTSPHLSYLTSSHLISSPPSYSIRIASQRMPACLPAQREALLAADFGAGVFNTSSRFQAVRPRRAAPPTCRASRPPRLSPPAAAAVLTGAAAGGRGRRRGPARLRRLHRGPGGARAPPPARCAPR